MVGNGSPFFKKIHYIRGGNGLAAIYVQNSTNTQDSLMYAYTDNQGSLIALTKENGDTIQTYAYDPWGARRNPPVHSDMFVRRVKNGTGCWDLQSQLYVL